MLAAGRPNGKARSEERNDDGGTHIAFSAELGDPRPDRALVGEVFLDSTLAWRPFTLEVDGIDALDRARGRRRARDRGRSGPVGVTVTAAARRRARARRQARARGAARRPRRAAPAPARALHLARRLAFPLRGPGGPRVLVVLVRPQTGVVVSLEDAAELHGVVPTGRWPPVATRRRCGRPTGAARADLRALVLGGLGASFLASFDLLIVVTALPSAARDLGGIGGYAFAAAAYAVAQVTGQPIGGALSDRAGPWRTLLVGSAVFAVGTAIGGSATLARR